VGGKLLFAVIPIGGGGLGSNDFGKETEGSTHRRVRREAAREGRRRAASRLPRTDRTRREGASRTDRASRTPQLKETVPPPRLGARGQRLKRGTEAGKAKTTIDRQAERGGDPSDKPKCDRPEPNSGGSGTGTAGSARRHKMQLNLAAPDRRFFSEHNTTAGSARRRKQPRNGVG